jgi:hypothetical protein
VAEGKKHFGVYSLKKKVAADTLALRVGHIMLLTNPSLQRILVVMNQFLEAFTCKLCLYVSTRGLPRSAKNNSF